MLKRLVNLALIGGAVAKEGERHAVVAAIAIGEGDPGPDRDRRADDAVPAVEILLAREHVHRAALALGDAVTAPGELGHHGLGVQAAGEHMPVVSVGGDDLVAVLRRHLHADDDRLLADVEMAEAGDDAHAVELPRLLLEAADQQHVAIGGFLLVERERRRLSL